MEEGGSGGGGGRGEHPELWSRTAGPKSVQHVPTHATGWGKVEGLPVGKEQSIQGSEQENQERSSSGRKREVNGCYHEGKGQEEEVLLAAGTLAAQYTTGLKWKTDKAAEQQNSKSKTWWGLWLDPVLILMI